MELTKKEESLIKAFRILHEPMENVLMFYKAGRIKGHDKLSALKDNEFAQRQIEKDLSDIKFLYDYTKEEFNKWD